MDSLTQIVLGAAVAEAVVGKKIGRKASLYGAVLGTLPDLDVFWAKNAVDSFTEHRSFSHSLIILLLVSPLFALLLRRWHPMGLDNKEISFRYWMMSSYLVLATHPLLDWFTVYGTQLLWPLTTYPFGLGSVFIIDPLYTVPFALLLLTTIITRKRFPLLLGIGLSCSYLSWSLFAQSSQHQHFAESFQAKGIDVKQSMTLPMPLNTMLWKNISTVDGGYWLSIRSVFDGPDAKPQFRFFKSESEQLTPLLGNESVEKLRYFTKGFYQVKQQDQGVWFSDLRMGGFGNFVFNFKVGEIVNDSVQSVPAEDILSKSIRGNKSDLNKGLKAIRDRIFDERVDLFPLFDSAEMIVSPSK
jgi:inner membrane protein